ncbi:uncharacterized protein LOC109790493 [Cajanus cajan]|uniref:uncharacterized protein LOC109790493 n=1 Tax=Cajanus cajan TaxID=3821 RepID=UPI00098DCA62|nr:uncharacterized protein LOC109790493 [Cajanus cajan]
MNSRFIFSMLQAFEPPLDMSQDVEFSEDPHPELAQKDHLDSEGINAYSCESAPLRITCSVADQHGCVEGSNHACRSHALAHPNEEVDVESCHQSNTGSHSPSLIHTKETSECFGGPISGSNGNVPDASSQQQWLDPSLQLNVPLVDVDKVYLCFQRHSFQLLLVPMQDNERVWVLKGRGFLGSINSTT